MAGPIRIAILSNGRQARADIGRTANSLGAIQRTASRATKVFAGVFAVRGLVRAAGAVGRVGAAYVDSLNKVQALTGANDRQMARIADRLEEQSGEFAKFGQTTGDAAQGLVELTKSGLTAQKALAAVRGTMTLAKAGELEVAAASELVANTLNTFNLKASKAADIANSLANAANISSANVSDVAESFKYVAPLAAKANVSVDQTNALLAELANSGIKASQAGTSLRKFLLSLQAPTGAAADWLKQLGVNTYDAAGKMRPIGDLIEDLRGGLSKLSQEDQNFALKSIFGLTGITGAQVILKGGAKGLAEYTKGVKRAGAATKLAESASKGLAGTLGSIKAQAISTTQSLYRQYSPELDARIQSAIGWLRDNQDQMIATADAAADRLGPALKALAELTKDAGEAFADTAIPLAKDLLPAIGDLLDLTAKAANVVNDLPGPVKEIGVQAAIAALILPRLTVGVTSVTTSLTMNIARLQQWRAEMTYATTRAQQTAVMMQRLGAAARTAAGIGGMVALTQSTSQSNEAMAGLLRTAGLAATGFAVGGPWGAAVGSAAGLGWQLYDALKGTDRQMAETAQTTAVDYAAALDKVTGAITELGRAQIIQKLQEDGIIASAQRIGITTRDLVGATLGHTGAIKRINAAYNDQKYILDALTGTKIRRWIYEQGIELDKARSKVDAASSGYTNWKAVLKGIPPKVQVQLRNLNYKPTLAEWRALNRQIDLTPKQRQIIIKAIGFDPAVTGAKKVGNALDGIGKKKGDLTNWQRGLIEGLTGGQQQVHRGVGRMNNDLDTGVRQGASKAAGTASSGGLQVGGNLKSGILTGFSGTMAALAAAAAAAVRQAVAAARAAGKIHSPSQETRDKVGKPLAQGIVVGFLEGVRKGSQGISNALDKLLQLIEKKYDGKKQAGKRKALIKSLRDERAELVKNGKAQDRVNKLLEKAEDRYKSLRKKAADFAQSIKDGFQAYGSIVGIGTLGGGTDVTLPAILSQLTARAAVADEFASVIASLRNKLNKTSLNQLLQQAAGGDLEGALATATAIAAGGQGAVAQINQLTQQISEAGAALGEKMRRKFFGHGLEVADGVVKGLEKRQRQLDRIADRLAKEFLKQAGLGTRAATNAGGGKRVVVGGTGSRTPALDAYMSARRNSVAAPSATVRVRLTAEQVSQLQRGKEIQADLDVYRAAGGRKKVRTP